MRVYSGQRYGRLKILSRDGADCLCQCDCGTTKRIQASNLGSGGTKSCGCLRREIHTKHGHKSSLRQNQTTPTYNSWAAAKSRCNNPRNADYHLYGGRGIMMCDRWVSSFRAFLEDMGERPEGCTLDRINSDGHYEKINCRWATPLEQANNSKKIRLLTYDGETKSLTEWARTLGITCAGMHNRITRGWTEDRIFSKDPGRLTCRKKNAPHN